MWWRRKRKLTPEEEYMESLARKVSLLEAAKKSGGVAYIPKGYDFLNFEGITADTIQADAITAGHIRADPIVFMGESPPPVPRGNDDMWIDYRDGKTRRWDGTHWVDVMPS